MLAALLPQIIGYPTFEGIQVLETPLLKNGGVDVAADTSGTVHHDWPVFLHIIENGGEIRGGCLIELLLYEREGIKLYLIEARGKGVDVLSASNI